jgi:hypothetical protein
VERAEWEIKKKKKKKKKKNDKRRTAEAKTIANKGDQSIEGNDDVKAITSRYRDKS